MKQTQGNTTSKTIQQFNEAFNKQDIDAVMALMTPDCIFENTYPPPDGTRHVGQKAVRKAFKDFFQSSPHAQFTTEEMFTDGNRGVVRWTYHWLDEHQQSGYIRGGDIFRIENAKVAEKLSYVKG